MNRRFLPVGALALTAIFSSGGAAAQSPQECAPTFSERSVTVTLTAADLGAGEQVVGSSDFTVLAGDDGTRSPACPFTIRLSEISGMPEFPPYVLTLANRTITPSSNETVGGPQSEVNNAIPASTRSRSINLRAVAATNWGLVAGRQTERLQLSLLGRNGTIIDRIPLNLELDIPKTVDVMFVGGAGGSQVSRVDLGTLSPTEATSSSPFGIRIWSSSGYQFSFDSQNRGTLQHLQGLDEIPYQFYVDGRLYSLGEGQILLGNTERSLARGDDYSLRITVPPRRSVAGDYQDRITVSVSAI